MSSKNFKKLIKYLINIIEQVISNLDTLNHNDYENFCDNLIFLIENINSHNNCNENKKNFYKSCLDEIKNKLDIEIKDISNIFNYNFDIVKYEEKYYEFEEYCIKINYIYKFFNLQISYYFGEKFFIENNVIAFFNELWNKNILKNFSSKIKHIISYNIYLESYSNFTLNNFNVKNTINIFNKKFKLFYNELVIYYLEFLKIKYNDIVTNLELKKNPLIIFELYKNSNLQQINVVKNYFSLTETLNIDLSFIKEIFIDKFIEIIDKIIESDNNFKILKEFFSNYLEIFDNCHLLDLFINKLSDKLFKKINKTTIIENYNEIREFISKICSSNFLLISNFNSKILKFIKSENIDTAFFLNKYIDENFKNFNYSYLKIIDIIDKDLFEIYYKKSFYKRLLKKKININKEYDLLNKLMIYEFDFTSTLNKLINDLVVSNSLENDIDQLVKDDVKINIKFFTAGLWPIPNEPELKCESLSKSFINYKNKIEQFYNEKYSDNERSFPIKRKLIWNKNLLTCTLRFNKYLITVNSDLVDLLLEFNNNSEISVNKYNNISLKKLLNLKLIFKKNDKLILNNNFTYTKLKIKI